ncbi:hypothetical protein CY34DRAFT_809960, partial [Suillus luteus UH-Slu-Lm8-n1]
MTSFSLHLLGSRSSHLQAGSYVPFESSSNFALDADLPSGLPCSKFCTHLPWTLLLGDNGFPYSQHADYDFHVQQSTNAH